MLWPVVQSKRLLDDRPVFLVFPDTLGPGKHLFLYTVDECGFLLDDLLHEVHRGECLIDFVNGDLEILQLLRLHRPLVARCPEKVVFLYQVALVNLEALLFPELIEVCPRWLLFIDRPTQFKVVQERLVDREQPIFVTILVVESEACLREERLFQLLALFALCLEELILEVLLEIFLELPREVLLAPLVQSWGNLLAILDSELSALLLREGADAFNPHGYFCTIRIWIWLVVLNHGQLVVIEPQ